MQPCSSIATTVGHIQVRQETFNTGYRQKPKLIYFFVAEVKFKMENSDFRSLYSLSVTYPEDDDDDGGDDGEGKAPPDDKLCKEKRTA